MAPDPASSKPPKSDPSAAASEGAATGQQTLSQLLARILDQLSVSAWFPAGVFVFLVLLIANIAIEKGSVIGAIKHIAKIKLSGLALLLGSVILTTVLTQAFELEAIRLLEGYWGPGKLARRLADWRSDRHVARLKKLRAHEETLKREALQGAKITMRDKGIPRPVIDAIEDRFLGQPIDPATSVKDIRMAQSIDFMKHATPEERRRHRAFITAISHYPPERLILPTHLGNTLKAYEQAIEKVAPGRVENFVREVFHELPLHIQDEHKQFRSRLDLYCSLLVVFLLTGVGATIVFATIDRVLATGTGLLTLILVSLSYSAALASAREYGRVLLEIVRLKTDH